MENSHDIYTFNLLYNDYKKRFTHFARTYVRDQATAEDLVMDGFLYYWENRHSLLSNANIPAYVLAVIKHKCLNYLRHEQVRVEVEKNISNQRGAEIEIQIATLEACSPEKLFSNEIQEIIHQTLHTLTSRSRDIFIRSKYENQPYKEIAAEIGLSVKSVEYHMTQTLKKLRKALKDYL